MISFETALLDNGMKVDCIRAFQVDEIQRQVRGYLRNGISVAPGDTVFDVGANIGLFTLLVHEACNEDVDVYAFEPIPDIYAALEANLRRTGSKRLHACPVGLSSESGPTSFWFTPNMATLSTVYGEDGDELREQVKNALLRNLALTPPHLRWLRILPRFLRGYMLDKATRNMFEHEEVSGSMRTLSEVIRENDIERIDLLKIDVEKSELDVLVGIEDPDWSRIRQIVIEVHDITGRLSRIEQLLRDHGHEVIVEQDVFLRGSNVFNLYATSET